MRSLRTSSLLLLVFAAACSSGGDAPTDAGADGPNLCMGRGVGVFCDGVVALTCGEGDVLTSIVACTGDRPYCVPGAGCGVCVPGTKRCGNQGVETCSADGAGFVPTDTCDPMLGETCDGARLRCVGACQLAAEERAYEGCEYWPVTLMNSTVTRDFSFAVAIGNGNGVPARIRVDRRGRTVAETVVPARSTGVVELPWVDELKQSFLAERSVLVEGGAYRVTSTVPVTAYQFSPLEYRIPQDCPGESMAGDMQCFSYSNDASLLLPTSALTPNYIVSSWPSRMTEFGGPPAIRSPGYFAVVGVDPGTTSVEIRFKADTLADFGRAPEAYSAGETATFTLERGDVLQLASAFPAACEGENIERGTRYCAMPREFDLTGTEIQASAPVAVLAGHNCAFVPDGRLACDHLEEMLPPLEAWGTSAVVARTKPVRAEPNVVRVLAAEDGTVVRFDPPIFEERTLGRGDFEDFEVFEDVAIFATAPVLVTQLVVGQDYEGSGTSGAMGVGDPSMAIAAPVEQYRSRYTVLVPESYEQSFVNVIAPFDGAVTIDGAPVDGLELVGSSGFAVRRMPVAPGVHTFESDRPFGLLVYGFGAYTSYAFSGGLDLRMINEPF